MKVLDNQQWISGQFAQCQLGDERRTKRLVKVAAAILACPERSLPKQNSDWSDLKAAYRLFDNNQVTFDTVAMPHWQQTRNTKPGRYLLISDTTDLSYKSRKSTTGLGILGDGRGLGLQLHNCLVYDCNEKQIIGTAGAILYRRRQVPKNETQMQCLKRIRESQLWGDLVDQIGSAPEDSQWIHVFDRGGDNFEAMCHIKMQRCDFVIRASKLNRNVIDQQGEKVSLSSAIKAGRVLGSYELNLRSRPGMAARTAKIEVSVVKVKLPRPRHHSPWVKQSGIEEIPLNVVVVQERDAPQGVNPIRWVLLTSLPVETFEDAWQVIEDYENRWLAEEYHKVLKTGCSVEGPALRTAERLGPLIALTSVIGIRLFQLKLVGRSQPDAKASTHVPSTWLKCLRLVRPKLKTHDMTVYEFFRELAKLGGFLGRKGDGEPGWQTTWHGYQRLHALLDGLQIAGAI